MDYWELQALGLTLSMSVMLGDMEDKDGAALLKVAALECAYDEVSK